ncbi:MAG: Crp/Fnr family transcriptional regulator [Planctomycetes bacterium]|nr:Crp/Fnr family transcriptional regulator [Planctomycetota bacterium]
MPDRETTAALGGTPLFHGLDGTDLARIAGAARIRRLDIGERLFRDGDEARHFFVVLHGRIKVFKVSFAGKEQILHVLGPWSTVAEAAAFAGGRFPASAEAMEPSRVIEIDGRRLAALLEARPALALRVIEGLCAKLREFNARIEDLSLKDVTARLAQYLVSRAERQGGAPVCRLDIAKHQLAAEIGTIAETLSRTMGRLKQRGWIEERPEGIALLAPDRLREIAAGLPPFFAEESGR